MGVVTSLALGILLVAALLVVVRLVKGPTTLDRAAAADVFVAVLLCGVAVLVARRGSTVFVPVLLALSLLGFASSVAVVRFLGQERPDGEPAAHPDDTSTGRERLVSAWDWVSAVLVLSGSLLALAAGIGMLRLPDLWMRMHAGTKPQVLGLLLVLAGVALQLLPDASAVVALLFVGLFQLVTAPVASHLLARAGHRTGVVPRDQLVQDDLRVFELECAAGEHPESPPHEDPPRPT